MNVSPNIIKKFLRFATIGLLNTGLHATVLVLLMRGFEFGAGINNVIAYLIASVFSFLLNARLSFKVRGTSKRFFRFQIVGILNITVCYSLGLIADAEGLHYVWLILMTAVLLPLVSFALHHRFSFA